MTNADRLGLTASLAVHALAALLMFWHPPIDERRKPIKSDVSIEERQQPTLKGYENEGLGLACGGHHYDGLGIITDAFGLVLAVGANTPAEKAGLRLDDVLLNSDDFWPGKYKPGTETEFIVRRGIADLRLRVVVGVICQE